MRNPVIISAAREQVHIATRRLQQATFARPDAREAKVADAVVALRAAVDLLTDDDG